MESGHVFHVTSNMWDHDDGLNPDDKFSGANFTYTVKPGSAPHYGQIISTSGSGKVIINYIVKSPVCSWAC
ncbi:hypothetical protein [Streptomyces sp. NPDC058701]|uniref:hypothetical protein n=1 Tax=Streptomyces sp. NPDC058701 TaxID=3346608 RepID=UPI003647795F